MSKRDLTGGKTINEHHVIADESIIGPNQQSAFDIQANMNFTSSNRLNLMQASPKMVMEHQNQYDHTHQKITNNSSQQNQFRDQMMVQFASHAYQNRDGHLQNHQTAANNYRPLNLQQTFYQTQAEYGQANYQQINNGGLINNMGSGDNNNVHAMFNQNGMHFNHEQHQNHGFVQNNLNSMTRDIRQSCTSRHEFGTPQDIIMVDDNSDIDWQVGERNRGRKMNDLLLSPLNHGSRQDSMRDLFRQPVQDDSQGSGATTRQNRFISNDVLHTNNMMTNQMERDKESEFDTFNRMGQLFDNRAALCDTPIGLKQASNLNVPSLNPLRQDYLAVKEPIMSPMQRDIQQRNLSQSQRAPPDLDDELIVRDEVTFNNMGTSNQPEQKISPVMKPQQLQPPLPVEMQLPMAPPLQPDKVARNTGPTDDHIMLVVVAEDPRKKGSVVLQQDAQPLQEIPSGQELASAFLGHQFGMRIKKGHFAFLNLNEKELPQSENAQLFDGKYFCQLCSNVDVGKLQDLGYLLQKIDKAQIITVKLAKALLPRFMPAIVSDAADQQQQQQVFDFCDDDDRLEVHLINTQGSFNVHNFKYFKELMLLLHQCQAIETSDKAIQNLNVFGKFLRGGGSSNLQVIITKPPPGQFRRSALKEVLSKMSKNPRLLEQMKQENKDSQEAAAAGAEVLKKDDATKEKTLETVKEEALAQQIETSEKSPKKKELNQVKSTSQKMLIQIEQDIEDVQLESRKPEDERQVKRPGRKRKQKTPKVKPNEETKANLEEQIKDEQPVKSAEASADNGPKANDSKAEASGSDKKQTSAAEKPQVFKPSDFRMITMSQIRSILAKPKPVNIDIQQKPQAPSVEVQDVDTKQSAPKIIEKEDSQPKHLEVPAAPEQTKEPRRQSIVAIDLEQTVKTPMKQDSSAKITIDLLKTSAVALESAAGPVQPDKNQVREQSKKLPQDDTIKIQGPAQAMSMIPLIKPLKMPQLQQIRPIMPPVLRAVPEAVVAPQIPFVNKIQNDEAVLAPQRRVSSIKASREMSDEEMICDSNMAEFHDFSSENFDELLRGNATVQQKCPTDSLFINTDQTLMDQNISDEMVVPSKIINKADMNMIDVNEEVDASPDESRPNSKASFDTAKACLGKTAAPTKTLVYRQHEKDCLELMAAAQPNEQKIEPQKKTALIELDTDVLMAEQQQAVPILKPANYTQLNQKDTSEQVIKMNDQNQIKKQDVRELSVPTEPLKHVQLAQPALQHAKIDSKYADALRQLLQPQVMQVVDVNQTLNITKVPVFDRAPASPAKADRNVQKSPSMNPQADVHNDIAPLNSTPQREVYQKRIIKNRAQNIDNIIKNEKNMSATNRQSNRQRYLSQVHKTTNNLQTSRRDMTSQTTRQPSFVQTVKFTRLHDQLEKWVANKALELQQQINQQRKPLKNDLQQFMHKIRLTNVKQTALASRSKTPTKRVLASPPRLPVTIFDNTADVNHVKTQTIGQIKKGDDQSNHDSASAIISSSIVYSEKSERIVKKSKRSTQKRSDHELESQYANAMRDGTQTHEEPPQLNRNGSSVQAQHQNNQGNQNQCNWNQQNDANGTVITNNQTISIGHQTNQIYILNFHLNNQNQAGNATQNGYDCGPHAQPGDQQSMFQGQAQQQSQCNQQPRGNGSRFNQQKPTKHSSNEKANHVSIQLDQQPQPGMMSTQDILRATLPTLDQQHKQDQLNKQMNGQLDNPVLMKALLKLQEFQKSKGTEQIVPNIPSDLMAMTGSHNSAANSNQAMKAASSDSIYSNRAQIGVRDDPKLQQQHNLVNQQLNRIEREQAKFMVALNNKVMPIETFNKLTGIMDDSKEPINKVNIDMTGNDSSPADEYCLSDNEQRALSKLTNDDPQEEKPRCVIDDMYNLLQTVENNFELNIKDIVMKKSSLAFNVDFQAINPNLPAQQCQSMQNGERTNHGPELFKCVQRPFKIESAAAQHRNRQAKLEHHHLRELNQNDLSSNKILQQAPSEMNDNQLIDSNQLLMQAFSLLCPGLPNELAVSMTRKITLAQQNIKMLEIAEKVLQQKRNLTLRELESIVSQLQIKQDQSIQQEFQYMQAANYATVGRQAHPIFRQQMPVQIHFDSANNGQMVVPYAQASENEQNQKIVQLQQSDQKKRSKLSTESVASAIKKERLAQGQPYTRRIIKDKQLRSDSMNNSTQKMFKTTRMTKHDQGFSYPLQTMESPQIKQSIISNQLIRYETRKRPAGHIISDHNEIALSETLKRQRISADSSVIQPTNLPALNNAMRIPIMVRDGAVIISEVGHHQNMATVDKQGEDRRQGAMDGQIVIDTFQDNDQTVSEDGNMIEQEATRKRNIKAKQKRMKRATNPQAVGSKTFAAGSHIFADQAAVQKELMRLEVNLDQQNFYSKRILRSQARESTAKEINVKMPSKIEKNDEQKQQPKRHHAPLVVEIKTDALKQQVPTQRKDRLPDVDMNKQQSDNDDAKDEEYKLGEGINMTTTKKQPKLAGTKGKRGPKKQIANSQTEKTLVVGQKQQAEPKQRMRRPAGAQNNSMMSSQATSDQYELLPCQMYPSIAHQPYRIYFTFEVQMLMYIHSYLSKNEVIGILGGQIYQTNNRYSTTSMDPVRILVVSKIYPVESCVAHAKERLQNCEISDADQIRINSQIDKDGVVKLAWYHSHPFFRVDPSNLDLRTHYSQQSQFDQHDLPFFGVIVGPYLKQQEVDSTLLNVFALRTDKELHGSSKTVQRGAQRVKVAERSRSFHCSIIPQSKLRFVVYSNIKWMMRQAAAHMHDRPNFEDSWTTRRLKGKYTYRQKFLGSLKKICDQNMKMVSEDSDIDPLQEIKDMLLTDADRQKLELQVGESVGAFTHTNESIGTSTLSMINDDVSQNNDRQDSPAVSGQSSCAADVDVKQSHAESSRSLRRTRSRQQVAPTPQLPSNNNERFFSMRSEVKVEKFLRKADQALIKMFKLPESIVPYVDQIAVETQQDPPVPQPEIKSTKQNQETDKDAKQAPEQQSPDKRKLQIVLSKQQLKQQGSDKKHKTE